MKKKTAIFAAVGVLVVILGLITFHQVNQNSEKEYQIVYEQGAVEEQTVQEAQCMWRDVTGKEIYSAPLGSKTKKKAISLLVTPSENEPYLYSEIGQGGYKLELSTDGVVIHALNQEGFVRGVDKLIQMQNAEANDWDIAGEDKTVFSITGKRIPADILVGDASLKDYVIVEPKRAELKPVIHELQHEVAMLTGHYPEMVKEAQDGQHYIEISVSDEKTETEIEQTTFENYRIVDGNIHISGMDAEACRENLHVFANTYMGLAFAGTEREHILAKQDAVYIPANFEQQPEPWIAQREPIICLWKTNVPRGEYYSPYTSLQTEILSFSDDQIYQYIKTMKYCGFTGIQVTDMCSAWVAYGGYEFVHNKLRYMADVAHSMDMNFTLWVWAAEFTGYGWVDEDVSYYDDAISTFAYENPKAIAAFDKYYSIYAELADCSDRVIAHFHDPGNLKNQDDINYFAAMLRNKMLSVNPNLDFGVSSYTDEIDRPAMVRYLGNDITIYGNVPHEREETATEFRESCKALGTRYGVWSWNLIEMEIDQLAEMNVNADIIQNSYLKSREADGVMKPEYWSEMDSYHLLNTFSLYTAGKLLQNPEQNPEEILHKISEDVVGEKYAEDLYQVLQLIQMARSGDHWESFRWEEDEYILKSEAYPAEAIKEKAEQGLDALNQMIQADDLVTQIPLAIDTKDLLRLIQPHVEQIQQYAEFRLDFDTLQEEAKAGKIAGLQGKVEDIYTPIPEYNCIIGMWGQPEAKAQIELLDAFCKEYDLKTPQNIDFEEGRKARIYQEFCRYQKGKAEPVSFDAATGFQFGMGFGHDETKRLVEELVEDGLLTKNEDGQVFITDWNTMKYHFKG